MYIIPFPSVCQEGKPHIYIFYCMHIFPKLLHNTNNKNVRFRSIQFRTYPARSIEEPSKEKVLRGSRDGFVETIVCNTALIRRRIRNPDLVMEIASVGKSSRTDVVLSYMRERADAHFLDHIRKRLSEISIDALTMNCESLAEKNWSDDCFV